MFIEHEGREDHLTRHCVVGREGETPNDCKGCRRMSHGGIVEAINEIRDKM